MSSRIGSVACPGTGRDKAARCPSGLRVVLLIVAFSACMIAFRAFDAFAETGDDGSAGGASPSCAEWNTFGFFEHAEVMDVSRCLDAGADPNAQDEDGWMPLHYAVVYIDAPAIVEVLLNAGADPNVRDESGTTPLNVAAASNATPAVVELLLNAGADPNVQNVNGTTPLGKAKGQNNTAIVEVLRNAGGE